MQNIPFVCVPRAINQPAQTQGKPPFTIHWKRVTYFAAPLVFSAVNLVEADYEWHRGRDVGENKRIELKERGLADRDGLLKGARAKGAAAKDALIEEAKNEAESEIQQGKAERETSIKQGHAKGAIPESLANGLILSLFGRVPEITQLNLERAEVRVAIRTGRRLKVDRKTGAFQLVERVGPDDTERLSARRSAIDSRLWALTTESVDEGSRALLSTAGGGSCGSR
jgi:hypothetical protein